MRAESGEREQRECRRRKSDEGGERSVKSEEQDREEIGVKRGEGRAERRGERRGERGERKGKGRGTNQFLWE